MKDKLQTSLGAFLLLGILVAVNLLATLLYLRMDVTRGRI